MPEISRFYGIVIMMFFGDHGIPHFHARYGRDKVAIAIEDLSVLAGNLPRRALSLVMEWAAQHQKELMMNWEMVKNDKQPVAILPLD